MDFNARRLVPNTLTMLNLLCGALAVLAALGAIAGGASILIYAVILVGAGAFFDVFDGLSARLLRVPSPMGVQLDSLADLLTFGFAPAAMYIYMFSRAIGLGAYLKGDARLALLVFPIILLAASAYRLAKFNVDTRQKAHFHGLPTPASALFTCGLALGIAYPDALGIAGFLTESSWALVPILLVQSFLVISDIPMFSLKITRFSARTLWPVVLLPLAAISAAISLKGIGLSIAVVVYIIVSVLTRRQILADEQPAE